MSKTIKKFERRLFKHANKLIDSLKGCNFVIKPDTVDILIEADSTDFANIMKQISYFEDEEVQTDDLYKNFLDKNRKVLIELEDMVLLRKSPSEVKVFKEYELLKRYLDTYEFSAIEQAEVVAYYFNITLKFILNVKIDTSEAFRRLVEKKLKNELGILGGFVAKKQIENELEKYFQNYKKELEIIKHIRDIIDENGILLANEYAKEYDWIFDQVTLKIPEEFVDLILQGSVALHEKQVEENKLIEQSKKNLQNVKEERNKMLKAQQENREKISKERREAIQELKKYLENDRPIKFITEEELLLVEQLLIKANYDNDRIHLIRKAIITNNLQISNREALNAYNLLLKKYLSVEEIEIITSAKQILTDDTALKNEFYYKIEENISEINTLLADLSANEDTENVEMLKLYIEELRDVVINYNLSDYRTSIQKRILESE